MQFDYSGFRDFLARHHHDFFRLWTWEGPKWVLPDSRGQDATEMGRQAVDVTLLAIDDAKPTTPEGLIRPTLSRKQNE